MKIGDVVFSQGISGYFNKDLQAVKAGAKANGSIGSGAKAFGSIGSGNR